LGYLRMQRSGPEIVCCCEAKSCGRRCRIWCGKTVLMIWLMWRSPPMKKATGRARTLEGVYLAVATPSLGGLYLPGVEGGRRAAAVYPLLRVWPKIGLGDLRQL